MAVIFPAEITISAILAFFNADSPFTIYVFDCSLEPFVGIRPDFLKPLYEGYLENNLRFRVKKPKWKEFYFIIYIWKALVQLFFIIISV